MILRNNIKTLQSWTISEVHLRLCQRSMMVFIGLLLPYKGSIIDVWKGPEYASKSTPQV